MSEARNAASLRVLDGYVLVGARYRRLPCGLSVLIHRDAQLPQVAVSMCYHAGSSDEAPDRTGLAHLTEHLFKNSLHLAGRLHYEVLRNAGATEANASTSSDRTLYHEVLPANQLALGLWLEADRMGYFVPALTHDRVAAQRNVVRNERRQRYENVAYGAERLAVGLALYPHGHPLRHLTIGLGEHIEAATYADVVDFYQRYYPPSNATLVIAGDLDDAECDDLVDTYFGSFPVAAPVARAQPALAGLTAATQHVGDRFARLRRLHWVWRGAPAATDEALALDALCDHWAGSRAGVLWQGLVQAALAQRVSAWHTGNRLTGELHIAVDVFDGINSEEVAAVVMREVMAAATAAIAEARIRRMVNRRLAGGMWAQQGLLARTQRLQYWALYGAADAVELAQEQQQQRLLQLTGATVQQVAARILAEPCVLIVTQPS